MPSVPFMLFNKYPEVSYHGGFAPKCGGFTQLIHENNLLIFTYACKCEVIEFHWVSYSNILEMLLEGSVFCVEIWLNIAHLYN